MNNQRQIAMAVLAYCQDAGEVLPAAASVWSDVKLARGLGTAPALLAARGSVLGCPNRADLPNGYVYNNLLSKKSLGDPALGRHTDTFLCADGRHLSPAAGEWPNVAYSVQDLDYRHAAGSELRLIVAFLDGHVDQANATPTRDWCDAVAVPAAATVGAPVAFHPGGSLDPATTWRVTLADGSAPAAGAVTGRPAGGAASASLTFTQAGNYRVIATVPGSPQQWAVAVTLLTTNPKDGAAMVWVPGGTFTMGTPAGTDIPIGEQSPHSVTLSGYYLYTYEVTAGQYLAYCTATGAAVPTVPFSWGTWTGHETTPIVNVNWGDAVAYATWAGVRLPTEAEWEYAARGADGRNYPWGGTAASGDVANGWDAAKCVYFANSGGTTQPVGSRPAGVAWCGAHDMAGNVWEWCADWYARPYAAGDVTDPVGPASGTYRLLRGGAWGFSAVHCRVAFRYNFPPGDRHNCFGFRCASRQGLRSLDPW